jgi:superfamily II DNA or RNA helicase
VNEDHGQNWQELRNNTQLIALDEAHHLGAPGTLSLFKNWYADPNTSTYFLGVTATPVHSEADLKDFFDTAFYTYLDDPKTKDESKNSFEHSAEDLLLQLELAIRTGDITPFERFHLLSALDFKTDDEDLFIPERTDEGGRYVLNPKHYQAVLKRLSPMLKSKGQGFIVTATIAEADRIKEAMNTFYPDIPVETLHSKTSSSAIEDLRSGELKFVISVKMLDEGINVPSIAKYIDLTKSSSIRQLVQRLSRPSRLYQGKYQVEAALFLSLSDEMIIQELDLIKTLRKGRLQPNIYRVSDRNLKDFSIQTTQFSAEEDEELKRLEQTLQDFWQKAKDKKRKELSEWIVSVDKFILTNRKKPSTTSEDDYERSLGGWLYEFEKKNPDSWWTFFSEETQRFLQENNLLRRRSI